MNAENAAKVVKAAVAGMPTERVCACASALKYAILTDRKAIPAAVTREKLALLLDEVLVTEFDFCNTLSDLYAFACRLVTYLI